MAGGKLYISVRVGVNALDSPDPTYQQLNAVRGKEMAPWQERTSLGRMQSMRGSPTYGAVSAPYSIEQKICKKYTCMHLLGR